MKKRNRTLFVVMTGLIFVASSCNIKQKDYSSTTEGNLDVYCAESISPTVTQLANEFNSLYTKAHVTIHAVPTRIAIVKLLNNETKLIVTSRQFNQGELDVIKKYKIDVDSLIVAYDAAVVIVNRGNPVDSINTDQLRAIYTGKITSWGEIEKRFSGRIIPVLESPNFRLGGVFQE